MLLRLFFFKEDSLGPEKIQLGRYTFSTSIFCKLVFFWGGGSLNTAVCSKYAVIPLTSVNKYSSSCLVNNSIFYIFYITLSNINSNAYTRKLHLFAFSGLQNKSPKVIL